MTDAKWQRNKNVIVPNVTSEEAEKIILLIDKELNLWSKVEDRKE